MAGMQRVALASHARRRLQAADTLLEVNTDTGRICIQSSTLRCYRSKSEIAVWRCSHRCLRDSGSAYMTRSAPGVGTLERQHYSIRDIEKNFCRDHCESLS